MRTINVKAALKHVDITTQEEAREIIAIMNESGWDWANGNEVSGMEREAIHAMAEGYEELEIDDAEMEAEAEVNGL